MATPLKDISGSCGQLSCLTFHLIALVIATVLIPCETRIISNVDENDIVSSISPELTSTSSPLPTSPSDSGAELTSNATTLKKEIPDLYEPYMKGMTSQLGDFDLEFALDYYSEKTLIKEYKFDSINLVKKLADSAMAHNTPPNSFLEEIQDLISLQNRSRIEPDESTTRDEVSQLNTGLLSESYLKRMAEGWKNELKRLEKKYNVSSECTGPDSITPTRLALMFPHYLNFGQRPFAVGSKINLRMNDYHTTTPAPIDNSCDPDYYDTYGRCPPAPRSTVSRGFVVVDETYEVPAIFKRAEFGGMIPLSWTSTPSLHPTSTRSTLSQVTKSLIGLHLFALYGSEQNDVIPFRTKCVLLRMRMQRCMLSNKRRIRFLDNNDITPSSLASSFQRAYDKLPYDFTSKINWKIFEFGENSISH
ncbi:unnamed protein product [Bemisia tabaci]|uniref:Uncharacterized protein n=1 Tax=Bemisia tabaci TaxID=7038 RepID=A0A9P0A8P1_BEMTA|nr:unnamed protein product [Bemisia tabaci]